VNAEHRSLLCHAPRLALAFLALGSCGDGENGKPDAAVSSIDAAPGVDAPPPSNPSVLWLNDIAGNEGNLRLVGQGPPSPF
jgi:hypothetical protein